MLDDRDRASDDVQDEPLRTDPDALPVAPDPQAGAVTDDDTREPEAARPLHPDVGEPIGP